MKDELAALLPRLEGGDASRELDVELWSVDVGVPLEWQGTTLVAGEHGVIGWCDPGERQRNFSTNRSASGPGSIPAYTTSLDAALALAKRVLPEHRMLELFECDDGGNWGAHWRKPETETAFAPKPALAFCAAIVKAKIGEVG